MRRVLAVLAICAWALSASAAPPAARSRTTLDPASGVWVGQRMTLVVELLVPGYFAGSPSFDLPQVAGMLLLPPAGHPVVSTEHIEDVDYTVQRHELLVFARQAGEFDLPAFKARVEFKTSPLDSETITQTVSTTPLHFSAKLPPGAEGLATLISAQELTAKETWQPEIGKAKVGDAFTRTITLSAADIPGMAFPPFVAEPIDGVAIYAQDPAVLDHDERGVLRGERRETITYVCQRAGRYVIPAAHLTWWNLQTERLETIDLPERVFEVAANPALASGAVPHSPFTPRMAATVMAALLAIVVLVIAARRIGPAVTAYFRPLHLGRLNPNGEQR